MTTGSALAQFTITLTQAASEQVAVDWYTSDGTAIANVDYAANKGTVLFAPGETSKTVDILVYGRAVGSEDRSFFVEMLPPANAILGASIGECIITVDTTGSTPITAIIVPTGPRGLEGKSAYQVWLDLGNAGSEQDFIDSLTPPIDEIAAEVAPLIDVGNTTLTAQGTDTLGHPDATTVKAVARRVAYVGAAKIATVTLADGENTLAVGDLTGDTIDFNGSGFVPRILRAGAISEPAWHINSAGKLVVKAAVAGDVLYAVQYDVVSKSQPLAREGDVYEHYERSTYNKLRSFEKGTHRQLTSSADVVLWETPTGGQGPFFRWDGAYPKSVPAGSTPLTTGGIAPGAWVSVGSATTRSDLASPEDGKGAQMVSVRQPFAGAATRNQRDKNAEVITASDFGAKGDGSTNDTASITPASQARGVSREYVVTAFGDVYGAELMPDGVAHDRIKGRVYNPKQQRNGWFFGQECLQFWFGKFAGASNKNAGDSVIRALAISGDSTTDGVGATYGTPMVLLEDLAESRGYSNVGVINRGQSGQATFQWLATHLAGDMTCYQGGAPHLLVLRWGANDPFYDRTVDQFITDLRAGLAQIRSQKTVAEMSILLMTPTSMNDVEKGRTEVWSERIGPAIRQAARDYQCAFMDTYALFQNSHDAAGIWMDNDTSNNPSGRAIHPHDVLYEHIMGKVADIIFPQHGTDWRVNAVRNCSQGDPASLKINGDLPSKYFSGLSMHRMAKDLGDANGGPYDGVAFTLKQADGAALQFSIPLPLGTAGSGMSMRLGWNNAWSNWYGEVKSGSGILSGGWTNFGSGYLDLSYQTTMEGRVFLNGTIRAGTTANGTTVFTLLTGVRPSATEIFLVPTENGTCKISIGTDGAAKIYGFGSGGSYLSLGGISFKASAN